MNSHFHGAVLALLSVLHMISASGLCDLACGKRSLTSSCAPPLTLEGNCCMEGNTTVIGLDLRNCNISKLAANFFRDIGKGAQREKIEFIFLEYNALTAAKTSAAAFRNFTSLASLSLPKSEAWEHVEISGGATTCSNQTDYCAYLDGDAQAHNVTAFCPTGSGCADEGPGLVACNCLPGHYGFKCLKEGQFPYATFFGSLGAVTVALSALLWFTQRRHVKPHRL